MHIYKWNLYDLVFNINYLKEKMSKATTAEELFAIEKTLKEYDEMMDIIEPNRELNLKDIFNWVRGRKIVLTKEKVILSENILVDSASVNQKSITKRTIEKLMENAEKMSEINVPKERPFAKLELTNEELIEVARDFFKQLKIFQVSLQAQRFLEFSHSELNIISNKNIDAHGQTFYDHVFGHSYVFLNRKNTIEDISVLVRQIMNSVYFYYKKTSRGKINYDLSESTIYAVDYFLLDYLKKAGFNLLEIQELEKRKMLEVKNQGSEAIYKVRTKLSSKRGIGSAINYDVDDVIEVAEEREIRELLKAKAQLIGYTLYGKAQENETGLEHSVSSMLQNRTELDPPYECSEADEINLRRHSKVLFHNHR